MKINCNHHASTFTPADAEEIVDEDFPQEALSKDALGLDGEYTFTYDYPLSRTATFKHTLTPEMNVIDILVQARADYEAIYKAEDEACGATENIPGMFNRQTSKGPYGIWGHVFSDLYFETVEINVNKRAIEFGMGS